MEIRSFWARGYRSLKDIRLDDLGPVNVFYGLNGAGKSNVLAGIHALFQVAAHRVGKYDLISRAVRVPELRGVIDAPDVYAFESTSEVVLGATVGESEGRALLPHRFLRIDTLSLEVTLERQPGDELAARMTVLRANGDVDLLPLWSDQLPGQVAAQIPPGVDASAAVTSLKLDLRLFVGDTLRREMYSVVPASRAVRGAGGPSESDASDVQPTGARWQVAALLAAGRLEEAFVVALTSPSAVVRDRLSRLRTLLGGPPLERPPFDPVHDFGHQRFELQERHPGPDGRTVGIKVELSGLGIQQVYVVLASALLAGTAAIAIEEPEAHLHAPTTGRNLRVLLRRVLDEGDLRQLFIATHSNLFDLDPTGYFDVRLDPVLGTVIERRENLAEIDRRHLYEPGPAKHGLQVLLRYLPPETLVFRDAAGRGISAEEMLRRLQDDDDDALAFLRDVVDTAVRTIQLRTRGATGT